MRSRRYWSRMRHWGPLAVGLLAGCGKPEPAIETSQAKLAVEACPKNECKLEFFVPENIPLPQMAIAASGDLRVNDRASITGFDGSTPVISNLDTSGTTRIGTDAIIGHAFSTSPSVQLSNRARINGSTFLAPGSNVDVQDGVRWAGLLDRKQIQKRSYVLTFKWPDAPTTQQSEFKAIDGATVENPTVFPPVDPNTHFGDATIGSKVVVELTAGDYFFDSLFIDVDGILRADTTHGPVRIFVAGTVNMHGRLQEFSNGSPAANAKEPIATRILLAAVTSESIWATSGFEGILLAPNAFLGIQGWASPRLTLRGAFIGKSVELHQGGALIASLLPEVIWPGTSAQVGGTSAVQKYVANLGFLDGSNCEYWPKDFRPADMETRLAAVGDGSTKDSIQQVVARLKQNTNPLQPNAEPKVTAFGSPRALHLAYYEEVDAADHVPDRRWVAVEPDTGVGYDISYQRLCSAEDMQKSICRTTMQTLQVNGNTATYQILGRNEQRVRKSVAAEETEAERTVMLIAPRVAVSGALAVRDAVTGEKERVSLNVNLIVAAANEFAGHNGAFEVKPYVRALPETWSDPAAVVAELKAPARKGLLAVFAGSMTNFTRVDVYNNRRLQGIGFHEQVAKPSLWRFRAYDPDETLFSEAVLPLKYAVLADPTLDQGPWEPEMTGSPGGPDLPAPPYSGAEPPDYFISSWPFFRPYDVSWGLNRYSDHDYQWSRCTFPGTADRYCGDAWTDPEYRKRWPFNPGNTTDPELFNLWSFTATQYLKDASLSAIQLSDLITDHSLRSPSETGGALFIFTASGSQANANAWPIKEVHFTNYHKPWDPSLNLPQANELRNRPPSDWANPLIEKLYASNTDKAWTRWDYLTTGSGPTLDPGFNRCATSTHVSTPRFPERGCSPGGCPQKVTVTLSCYKINPLKITVLGAGGAPLGNTSMYVGQQSALGRSLAGYLDTIIAQQWSQNPVASTQDQVVTTDATLARVAAQVLSTGGDPLDVFAPTELKSYFYRQVADYADTLSLQATMPTAEYDMLRDIVIHIDPTVSGDMGVAQSESARTIRMSDSRKPGAARLNALALPYGQFGASWRPHWAGSDAFTLSDVQDRWASLRAQSQELRAALDKAQNPAATDIASLRQQLMDLVDTVSTHASQVGEAASRDLVNQGDAITKLAGNLVTLQGRLDEYRTSLGNIYGCQDCTWEQLTEATNAKMTKLGSQCRNPSILDAIQFGMKFVPLLGAAGKAADLLADMDEDPDQLITLKNAFTDVAMLGHTAIKDITLYTDAWDKVSSFLTNAADVGTGISKTIDLLNWITPADLGRLADCAPDSPEAVQVRTILEAQASWRADMGLAEVEAQTVNTLIGSLRSTVEYQSMDAGASSALVNRLAKVKEDLESIGNPSAVDLAVRNRALVNACRTFRSAARTGEQDLYALSQMLQTSAGRAATQPGLVVPASGRDPGASADMSYPYLVNVWDPTGFDAFSATNSFVNIASKRFTTFVTKVCHSDQDPTVPARNIFMVTHTLSAAELAAMRTDPTHPGYVSFSLKFTDLAGAVSQSSGVNPFQGETANGPVVPLSAPVVVAARYFCPGGSCGLQSPPMVVHNGKAWVPSASGCDADGGWLVAKMGGADGKLVRTCPAPVEVPNVYEELGPFHLGADVGDTLLTNTSPLCSQGPVVTPLAGARGVPLLGDWVFTWDTTNAERLVYGKAVCDQETCPDMPVPRSAPADWAQGVTQMNIVFFIAAEVKSTHAPASYQFWTNGSWTTPDEVSSALNKSTTTNSGTDVGGAPGGTTGTAGTSGSGGVGGGNGGGGVAGGTAGASGSGGVAGGNGGGGVASGAADASGSGGVAGGNGAGGTTEPCSPSRTVSGGQSGNFNTAGSFCLRTADNIIGWGCSNFDGRTMVVNGTPVTCGAAPLPAKVNGYYYFAASSGSSPWASVYWW